MIAKFRVPTAASTPTRAWHCVALALWVASSATGLVAAANPDPPPVVFNRYSSLASFSELARRLLSPFEAEATLRRLQAGGGTPASQLLDLSGEKFLVRIPPQKPKEGYALLVFIPPWQHAALPEGWGPTLDQHGFMFVSAARSGNTESTMGRREPLALLAAYNLMRGYPIDPRRVYIGGFSGGSRVALRLALGYPDLFRGALLNAGSDVIGNAAATPPIPLPPRELLYQFQESSRLVYVTGERDEEHLPDDMLSLQSLKQWCMVDPYAFTLPRLAHAPVDAQGLARALDALDAPRAVDADRLGHCREALQADLDARFRKMAGLLADGQRDAAVRALEQIDRRFGGLAAPRSLELLHSNSPDPP